MITYSQFKKMNIDLSPLGFSESDDPVSYYCTPENANILGTAGIDGIHYCTVPDYGEVIFAVSPMNFDDCYTPSPVLLRICFGCFFLALIWQH